MNRKRTSYCFFAETNVQIILLDVCNRLELTTHFGCGNRYKTQALRSKYNDKSVSFVTESC